MEEKKLLGMPKNICFGLTWLCFVFGIVLLAIEHEKMEKEDKLEVVSCFCAAGILYVIGIVANIISGIVELPVIGSIIFAVCEVLLLIKMIFAFLKKDWKFPIAYNLAEKFVK